MQELGVPGFGVPVGLNVREILQVFFRQVKRVFGRLDGV